MSYSPVAYALLAMVAWGLWTVLADAATETVEPTVAMVLSYATSVAVAVAYVALSDREITLTGEGVGLALVAGVFAGVGAVAFYAGLDAGRTGVVTTISAMYFVVAAVLGVAVFGDAFGLREVAGVGFAVIAVVLLAG